MRESQESTTVLGFVGDKVAISREVSTRVGLELGIHNQGPMVENHQLHPEDYSRKLLARKSRCLLEDELADACFVGLRDEYLGWKLGHRHRVEGHHLEVALQDGRLDEKPQVFADDKVLFGLAEAPRLML